MQEPDSYKQCSLRSCAKRQSLNPDVCFYPFPSELVTCQSWVEATERRDFIEDFEYSGASSFVRRFVCSDHFRTWDFCTEGDVFSGLKENVVPCRKGDNDIEVIEVKQEMPEDQLGSIDALQMVLPEQKIDCTCVDLDPAFEGKCTACDTINKHHSLSVIRRKEAERAATRRLNETEGQRRRRLRKEAQRASLRRMRESVEEKQTRRLKNCVRSRLKRQHETEDQAAMRRYNDAVRAALRRQMETEEQREHRRAKDLVRAAVRRQTETPEQREERLRKDRERVGKKRKFLKIAKQMNSVWLPVKTDLCGTSAESVNIQDFSEHMAEYTQL